MMAIDCGRETEVAEIVSSGATLSEDLGEHIESCPVCRDLVDVLEAFRETYTAELQETRVPPPMLLWWRAELQLRRDAARRAVRPITLAHAFAAAAAIGVALALGRLLFASEAVFDRVGELTGDLAIYGETAVSSVGVPLLLIGAGCCLMLAPLAAWLLSED